MERARETDMASEWMKRSPAGIYRRIGSDGKSVVAEIIRGVCPVENGGYREGWNLTVHPRGEGNGFTVHRYGYKTLREAKSMAEIVFRQAKRDLEQNTYPV